VGLGITDKFYYIDDNGEKIVLTIAEFDGGIGLKPNYGFYRESGIGSGTEGVVYRHGDLAFKIIHTFNHTILPIEDKSAKKYEYFKELTVLKNTIVPKHILFQLDTGEFCGYTSTFIPKIDKISNFRCSNLLESFLGLLSDADYLGHHFVRTHDSSEECNFIFGKTAIYAIDPGRWLLVDKEKYPDSDEWHFWEYGSVSDLIARNKRDFSIGIANFFCYSALVDNDVTDKLSPLCDEFVLGKGNPIMFYNSLVKELGSYPTLGDYGADRRK
jgi:hypothetical protein